MAPEFIHINILHLIGLIDICTGLIDHEEAVVLELGLEKHLKEMNARIPLSLEVAPPVSVLHQLSWIENGEEEMKEYLVVCIQKSRDP